MLVVGVADGLAAELAFGGMPDCGDIQAAPASVKAAMIRPRVVLRLVITVPLWFKIIHLTCLTEYTPGHLTVIYFPFVAAGEAAGAGLTACFVAGLAVVAGAVSVVGLGEAAGAVAGVVVVAAGELEFELLAGSSEQPTANAIARRAGSNKAVRLINLDLELLIVFSSFEQD